MRGNLSKTKGSAGATFTPHISEDGVLSWSNNGGFPNPAPLKIQGKDGHSPLINVTQLSNGAQIGITDESGITHVVTLKNGRDGTSPTVLPIADTEGRMGVSIDGEEIWSGLDGKDGEQGIQGEKGEQGIQGLQGKQGIQGEKGEKGDTGEQGIQGEAGKDGYTPVKGVDYFTPEEKASMINEVIEAFGGSPVHGYVDEDNNIIISGNLQRATYAVKYETEDGSTVDIGYLVFDSNVYYSVTNNLTNCTNSNGATQVIGGQGYTATITVGDGYELSSVVLTMGGVDITADAVSGGTINIASVTGDIVVTAVAKEQEAEITNWIKEAGIVENTRLSLGSGDEKAVTGYECTGFIRAKKDDVLYIKDVELTDEDATNIIFYDLDKNPLVANANGTSHGVPLYYLFVEIGTQTGDVYSYTLESKSSFVLPEGFDGYIRIGSTSITEQSVLNIKRDEVWT